MSNQHDKDLDDFLAGDSPVSDLYRKSAGISTPKALDDRIINQAHQAIEQHHAGYSPFSGRWIVPASLAAVIVISITVIMQVPVHESSSPGLMSELEAVKKQAEQDSLAGLKREDSKRKTETGEYRSKEVAEKPRAAKMAAPAQPATPAKEMTLGAAEDKADYELFKQEQSPVPESLAQSEPAPAPMLAETAREEAPLEEATGTAMGISRQANTATATVEIASKAEAVIPSANEWIDKILKLLDKNQLKQASEEYKKFREHYPDHQAKKIAVIESRLGLKH